MAAIVGEFCTEWYWERCHLAMMMFIYCSKGEGDVYILTRQIHIVLHPYQNLGLVSPGWIILCHIMLTSFLPSQFHVVKAAKKFISITTGQYMTNSPTNMAILSIMMSLWINSIIYPLVYCDQYDLITF